MIIPEDLKARTEAAILRITTGQAPMRVPVDPSDPDVVLAEWLRVATPMPTADADPEVLATVTLGGYFSSEELGDIDIEPVMSALEQIQQDVVRSDDDAHLELVDRAHVTRLQAEVSALQQRLTVADQRVDDLESGMTEARGLVRWLYTHANVHQVGTVMMDSARQFIANQSAPERTPQDYAIEHAGYLATAADSVQEAYKAYSLAQMNVDEGGDDGEGELNELVDDARNDLHEALHDLRGTAYEFRKRRDRAA